jgi:hypothetical protein
VLGFGAVAVPEIRSGVAVLREVLHSLAKAQPPRRLEVSPRREAADVVA